MGCDSKDLLRRIGELPDGRIVVSRHKPDHSVGLGTVRQAPPGRPMAPGEEYVSTKSREDGSFEIVDSYAHGEPARSGPAQVATAPYRAGWDRTFNAPGGDA